MNMEVAAVDRIRYYTAFLDFLKAVGEHQAIVKMGVNVEGGVYPVQKVAYEYNLRGARLDQLIYDRNLIRWSALDMLDHWSQVAGFKRINPEHKYKIIKFYEDYDRRRYTRDNIRRAMKKSELLSIADFMEKRLKLERAKKEKEEAQAGE